jgi:hypothetical protein
VSELACQQVCFLSDSHGVRATAESALGLVALAAVQRGSKSQRVKEGVGQGSHVCSNGGLSGNAVRHCLVDDRAGIRHEWVFQ